MAVTVKKAKLWRKELDNTPGTLAKALAPLAAVGVSLRTVMGYRFPGDEERAAVEVWPVEGKKAEDAARKGGLHPFGDITCLMVEGNDRAGLGARISQSLAENGINIAFVMTLVSGKKYVSIMGFDSERDADRAAPLIKRANLSVAAGKKTAKVLKKAGKAAQRKAVTKAKTGAKKTAVKKTAGAKKVGAKKTTAKKSATRKTASRKTSDKKSTGAKKPGRKAKSKKS
jgi:hypothetical protein